MNRMPFPAEYAQALRDGSKTVTIRVSDELGAYSEGGVCAATTYDGDDLGVELTITKVTRTNIGNLASHGIPPSEVARVLAECGGDDRADIIEFKTRSSE